jgi:pyruvate dehydrogenase E1 component alpha subunit
MIDAETQIGWYRRMRLLRRFEERALELVEGAEIAGPVHAYLGEEAVAVGVCSMLGPNDVITSTHRGHGHILAKGGDPARMFAELLGRETGYNKGRGGSMHIADLGLGIFGANGIVGAGAPMGCGAAYMFKLRGERHVAVPFFGDGAVNQGVLLESFNLAAVLELPMVFVCENNGYAISSPIAEMTRGAIHARAAAFGLAAETADGMDVRSVAAAAARAVARARDGGGPSFLECRTSRYSLHNVMSGVRAADERPAAELAADRARDAIERLAVELSRERIWGADQRAVIDGEIERELEGAIGFARNSRRPDPESALEHMYATTYPGLPARGWQ